MNACLRTQPAKGIFTLKVDRGAFDARHISIRNLDHFSFEAFCFAPTQIHAQQHISPVLCFRASRTRLYINKSIIRVHLSGEHTPEFQLLQVLIKTLKV